MTPSPDAGDGSPLDGHWSDYRTARATAGMSAHSWSRFETEYRAVAKHLQAIVGHPPDEADLTRKNLREAFNRYSTEQVVKVAGGRLDHRGKSTVAGAISTWNRFLTFLVVEETIAGNPMAAVEKPKVPKPPPKALEGGDATMARLVESLQNGDRAKTARRPWPERDLAVVLTYGTTGLRQQELAGLALRDFDLQPDGGSGFRVLGKGDVERRQPVPDETVLAIAEYLDTRATRFPPKGKGYPLTAPLFVNDDGGRLTASNIRHLVRTCIEAAGLGGKLRRGALVHGLRHAYATDLANQKQPATVIQKLLGHSSLATSQRYVDVSDDVIRDAAQESTMAKLMKGRKAS